MIKNTVITIQFIVIVTLAWFLYKGSSTINKTEISKDDNYFQQAKVVNPYKDTNLSFEFIEAEGATWGYKILIEGNVVIVQPNKPGLPGNEGFKTKEQAQKVAELVISKIRNGEMPPTITLVEMKNLNAL